MFHQDNYQTWQVIYVTDTYNFKNGKNFLECRYHLIGGMQL